MVFVKDVGIEELPLAILLAFLEIATKLARSKLLSLTRVDSKGFDSITIILCFVTHLLISIGRVYLVFISLIVSNGAGCTAYL